MLASMNNSASQANPRARTGVSRLSMIQARFQAQQTAEKEEKLINLLEQRQEEVIRQFAYGGRNASSAYSANSLSSNGSSNSRNPSMSGRPPGKVRQMFEERRNAAESSGNTSPRHETTPVGWDKSYPLQPVGNASSGTGLYRRNSTARTGDRPNKYSGNYGPKARSNSVNRAVSMDRSRYAPSSESGYSSASVARTRSHHQLGNQSSGEDSYASSSRPQSRSGLPPVAENNNKYATFAGRSSFRSRNSYSIPDPDCSPPESRKTSYTHEYVRNLPPTATSTLPRGRLSRPNQHRDSMSSSYDQYSYSSQSSDKSDPQITASRSHHQLGPAYSMQSNTSLTQIPGPRSSSKSRLHSTSLRHTSRSPARGCRDAPPSRSPSPSPVRRSSRGRSRDVVRNRSPSADEADGEYISAAVAAAQQQQEMLALERRKEREKEEEKRRLALEMRKREMELLERIKDQQRQLETMKQEKSKAQQDLQRQELLRERERKAAEAERKKQEQKKERERKEQERKERERMQLERREQEQNRERERKEHDRKERERKEQERKEQEEEEERNRRRRRKSNSSSRDVVLGGTTNNNINSSSRGPIISRSSLRAAAGAPDISDDEADRPTPFSRAGNGSTRRSGRYKTTISIGGGARDGDEAAGGSSPVASRATRGGGSTKPPSTPRAGGGPFKPKPSKSVTRVEAATTPDSEAVDMTSRQPRPSPRPSPRMAHKPLKATGPGSEPPASPSSARKSIFATKARDDLVACNNCGRNFAEDRIEKHTQICLKTSQKKRKTFNMTKVRTEGTEAAQFIKKGKKASAAAAKAAAKKPDWRKKREEMINALRAAKEAQRHVANGGKLSDLPPPPPLDTSDYIQCPHCQRRFNETAAERHIPKCSSIKSNKRR